MRVILAIGFLVTLNQVALAGDWDTTSNPPNIFYDGGNVGIGETSPEYPLEISHSNVDIVSLKRITSGAGASLRFENGNSKVGRIWLDGIQRMRMDVGSEIGDTKMTISQSGNVGIGTINPLSKLQILNSTPYTLNEDDYYTDSIGLYGAATNYNGQNILEASLGTIMEGEGPA